MCIGLGQRAGGMVECVWMPIEHEARIISEGKAETWPSVERNMAEGAWLKRATMPGTVERPPRSIFAGILDRHCCRQRHHSCWDPILPPPPGQSSCFPLILGFRRVLASRDRSEERSDVCKCCHRAKEINQATLYASCAADTPELKLKCRGWSGGPREYYEDYPGSVGTREVARPRFNLRPPDRDCST